MKTDFDFSRRYIFAPTVFNADFNNFATITANQAWSLFFTAGQDDAAIGDNPELGRFLNNVLAAVIVASVIGACIFFRSF